MSSLGTVFEELRKRHLFRIAVLYLGIGWILVEIAGFVADNYDLSRKIIDVTVLLAILGFPAVLITGWFHGEKGHQHAPQAERWLLLTLGVLAAVGTYRITTAEVASPEGAEPEAGAIVAPAGQWAIGSEPSLVGDTEDLGERSIAVFPFANNVSDAALDWLGSGLADMLTTNFAQIPELRVVGRQRLFDLLREAGHAETDEIPESLAEGIAVRSGARAMVRGTIFGREGDLSVDAQLIDLRTGTVIAADRVRGEDLFALIDTLSMRLAGPLLEEEPVRIAERAPLTRVGTRDMEAARAYHEGVAAEREARPEEARVHFEQAVQLDSGYVLPLLKLRAQEGAESEQAARYMRMVMSGLKRLPPEVRASFEGLGLDTMAVFIRLDSIMDEALGPSRLRPGIPPGRRPVRRPPPPPR